MMDGVRPDRIWVQENNPMRSQFFAHEDTLAILGMNGPIEHKLRTIHKNLSRQVPDVDRIAVAVYDPGMDMLKTFIASSELSNQLVFYDARLADSPSLKEIVRSGRSRLVNDLELFPASTKVHTQVLRGSGFRSSYTMPILLNESLLGFIFFNSMQPHVFTEEHLEHLDVHGHLIAALVALELFQVRVLSAAAHTAHDMMFFRDPETGGHIDRLARYVRLITRHLAATGKYPIDDRMIERMLEFAPLHDIGKLGVPDNILLKPSQLTTDERETMKLHTTRGLRMIDVIARNFGLEHLDGFDVLQHVIELHHEMLDGSGYPRGLKGSAIPLEARIVAVADIFDALTSARSYKPAWSNEEAFEQLRKMTKDKLDADCVSALLQNEQGVVEIQRCFMDASAGAESIWPQRDNQ
jgi:HD-GYP domain-containing protein (c-di-GMP phosphodiesterase class II)